MSDPEKAKIIGYEEYSLPIADIATVAGRPWAEAADSFLKSLQKINLEPSLPT